MEGRGGGEAQGVADPKENVDIFYGLLEYLGYFITIWDILLPFGTFCVHFVQFFCFWYHVPRKIWQPCESHLKNLKIVKFDIACD
jgi:hypothetical protein